MCVFERERVRVCVSEGVCVGVWVREHRARHAYLGVCVRVCVCEREKKKKKFSSSKMTETKHMPWVFSSERISHAQRTTQGPSWGY